MRTPRSRGPWPIALAIVVLAIVGALIWWLSTSPNRVSSQSTVAGDNVQLTKLNISTPTVAGAADVTGAIVNRGNEPVTGVTVNATFKNIQNHSLETVSAQLEAQASVAKEAPKGAPEGTAVNGSAAQPTHGFKNPGGSAGEVSGGQGVVANGGSSAPGFAAAPIAPGQSANFVIHFQRVPEGWTGNVPELKITNVATTGKS